MLGNKCRRLFACWRRERVIEVLAHDGWASTGQYYHLHKQERLLLPYPFVAGERKGKKRDN